MSDVRNQFRRNANGRRFRFWVEQSFVVLWIQNPQIIDNNDKLYLFLTPHEYPNTRVLYNISCQ